jgi:ribosomal protein S18 acetylase RimI-like enzyme
MSSEVEIRSATRNDWRELAAVHTESYRSTYRGIMPDDYLDDFTVDRLEKCYQQDLNAGTKQIGLLFVDRKAAGFIAFGKCSDVDLDARYGEIREIYFLQAYQAKGLGTKLIEWASGKLKELGYSHVSVWVLEDNAKARMFYERLGFTFDGTEKVISRGKPLIQVRGATSILQM